MGFFKKLFGGGQDKTTTSKKPAPAPTPKLAPPITQPPKTDPPRRPTILVVDDEEAISAVLTEYLEGEGFKVFTAADGWQAAIQAEGLRLDLVITDIMMPGPQGSGVDAYNKLRASHAVRKDLPIIFLTAMPREQVLPHMPRDSRLKLLFKPIDFAALREAIRALTGR